MESIIPSSAVQLWGSGWLAAAIALGAAVFLPLGIAFALPMPKRRSHGANVPRNILMAIFALVPPLVTAAYLVALQAGDQSSPQMAQIAAVLGSGVGLVIGAALYAFPSAFALCRASLGGLPAAAVDAAQIDGASAWQIRRALIWPHVRERFLGIALLVFCNVIVGFGFILMIATSPERSRVVDLIRGSEFALVLLAAAAAAGIGHILRQGGERGAGEAALPAHNS